MTILARLERRFGRFAIPNLTAFIIAGQVVLYMANAFPAGQGPAATLDAIRLEPDKVVQGEYWRVITYLFDPPATNPLFAFFFWYLFYLMGTTLEAVWGAFRYNMFLAIGFLASIAMAFVFWFVFRVPGIAATNAFVQGTVFLAFARLYPDFTLMIFFVLPVKIRWLALIAWIWYGLSFLTGNWMTSLMIVASVLNYLLFFGRDIRYQLRHGHRRMQFRAKAVRGTNRIVHECKVCGVKSSEAPQMQFRYCSKCGGDFSYCPEHFGNHEHISSADGDHTSAISA
jgi:hypothetical protein